MASLQSNGSTVEEFSPSGGIYVLIIVVVLTAIASVLGNLVVQLAYWRTTALRESSPATLVMALSVADFVIAVLVMPFVVTTALHNKWTHNHDLCVASGFLNTFLTAIQFGMLFAISINRFAAISFPHRYQTRWKSKTTWAMVLVVVAHSLLWSIMPFLGWGGYDFISGTLFCNINWSEHKAHSTSLFACCYIIPAVVAAILYVIVYIRVRRMKQNPAAQQRRRSSQPDIRLGRTAREDDSCYSDVHSKSVNGSLAPSMKGLKVNGSATSLNSTVTHFRKRRTRESRVTISLLLVAAAFAICWLPRGLVNFWAVVSGRDSIPRAIEYLTTVFIFMSSFVNPIIYALFHHEYNRAFRKILGCNIRGHAGSSVR